MNQQTQPRMSKITPISALDVIIERVKSASVVKKDSQVAVVLGVPKANISAWRRRGTIPFENLYAYSIAQNVSFDWLMRGEGSPSNQKNDTAYQVAEDPNHCRPPDPREKRLTSFIHYYMANHDEDEKAWFEIDFGKNYTEYLEFKALLTKEEK